VLAHLPEYTPEVQQRVAAQLAAQIGVQANQVSLTTPYFPVVGQVVVTGARAWECERGLGQGVYMRRKRAHAKVVDACSDGGRKDCIGSCWGVSLWLSQLH